MNVAREPRYGGALVDTAAVVVKIKEAILTGVRQGASERSIKAKVKKLIDEFCKQISDETYKMRARRVLAESFAKWYSTTQAAFLALPFLLLSRFDGVPKKTAVAAEKQFNLLPVDIRARIADLTPHAEYGREWHDSDYRKRLKEAYTRYVARLADDDAKYSKHVSLRNLAEVEVRRQEIADMLGRLRSQGVRLAWSSSHVDCSKRCAPWQGRLYSLDGTSGVENGTSFVPIETAINVVDKYGNINGLFGYNCFDDKTEIFTDKGWKLFAELDGTEKIYTLSPETRETEWQKPLRFYIGEYSGEMVWLHNQSTDLMCTPNHDLLYFTQKDNRLRFKEAKDFSTATFLYAGQQWKGEEADVIELGGKKVDAKLYCRFMAYYLSDGSRHAKTAVKIAQRNNEKMFEELQGLPFKVWRDNDKIVIHDKSLADELAQYGTAAQKYVPPIIKTLSRGLICEFLDAYLKTDGYVARQKKASGFYSEHKSLFTTSEQMANDLGELALKAGYRPKFDRIANKGKTIAFRNGEYTLNHDLWVVHLNKRVNITHLQKDVVHYNGFIYCVEVPNHTLLVRRNGRVVWCGNCRHRLVPYTQNSQAPREYTHEQMSRERAIDQRQRELEKLVRRWKERGYVLRRENKEASGKAFERAKYWEDVYKKYSLSHGRAFYRERITVMREEYENL